MTRTFLMCAVIAAYPLAISAEPVNDNDGQRSTQQTRQHGSDVNPSSHHDCSCPADCACRTEHQTPCDCGCTSGGQHQHD